MTDRAPALFRNRVTKHHPLAKSAIIHSQPCLFIHILPLAALRLHNWIFKTKMVLYTKHNRLTVWGFYWKTPPSPHQIQQLLNLLVSGPLHILHWRPQELLFMKIFTNNGYHIRNEGWRLERVAPQWRALSTLPEDVSSVPSTHNGWLTTHL